MLNWIRIKIAELFIDRAQYWQAMALDELRLYPAGATGHAWGVLHSQIADLYFEIAIAIAGKLESENG